MNSNYSIHKVAFYVLSLCYISLFTSCTDEDVLDKQYGEMCEENISFGVSKDVSSWKPDSRVLSSSQPIVLPCISNDKIFGVSMMVKEKLDPLSRGTQFSKNDTLKAFDVAAYHYEENNSDTELFFNEKVNDGIHIQLGSEKHFL